MEEVFDKSFNFNNVDLVPNWGPMNFKLLERVINNLPHEQLLKIMTEFVQQRRQFLISTTIMDFTQILEREIIYPPGFIAIQTKHSLDPSTCTMEWIDSFSEDFSEHHSFNDCAILLKHIAANNQITVAWILPYELMKRLKNDIMKCAESECEVAAKYSMIEILYDNGSTVCFKMPKVRMKNTMVIYFIWFNCSTYIEH